MLTSQVCKDFWEEFKDIAQLCSIAEDLPGNTGGFGGACEPSSARRGILHASRTQLMVSGGPGGLNFEISLTIFL